MSKKTYTPREVRDILKDILHFIGGTDSEVAEYIKSVIDGL